MNIVYYLGFELVNASNIQFKYKFNDKIYFETLEVDQRISNLIENKQIQTNFDLLTNFIGIARIAKLFDLGFIDEVHIQAISLSDNQLSFFEDSFFQGLGEYKYKNRIDIKQKTKFFSSKTSSNINIENYNFKNNSAIILNGGGKDTAVSVETALSLGLELTLFSYQENISRTRLKEKAGIVDTLILQFIQNKNMPYKGHKPFSMLLSFLSLWLAYLTDIKYIITANEYSANFPTAIIEGIAVNHQYSKSFEYEEKFNNFINGFNIPINYFSILRPLYEIQIANIFSKLKKYHNSFISCNRIKSQQEGKWCLDCPKCAFVFLILSNFTDVKEIENIFGTNPINILKIRHEILNLCNEDQKPFECVGDINESKLALKYYLRQNHELEFSEYPFRKNLEEACNDLDLGEATKVYLDLNTTHANLIPDNLKNQVFKFFESNLD